MSDPVWIEVSAEAVEAAKLHVEAMRSAGLQPDPVVAAMAEAEERDTAPHQVTLWVEDDGTTTGVCACGWGYASPDLHAFADALADHLRVPAQGRRE